MAFWDKIQNGTPNNSSAAKTPYQQNFSQPIQQEWKLGDKPTNYGQALATINQIAKTDPTKAQQKLTMLDQFRTQPGNIYYDAYSKATNGAVNNLASYGIDARGLTPEWFQQNTGWQNYLSYNGTTNTPSKPGKKASQEELIAYDLYQYQKGMDTTGKAKSEWAAAQQEIAYWAGRSDLNLSDDDIIRKVFGSNKYSTLKKMDDTRTSASPLELNEAIGYNADSVRGTIWAARNGGGTGNSRQDIANYYLKSGNSWKDDPNISAKLNIDNLDTFSRYEVGMAGDGMDKAGVYFGVPSFSKADVEALRNNVDWEDETSVKMYQTVLAAEETTEKAETELANLTKAFQRRLNRGFKDQNEANKWIDSQLESSDYSTLAKMDASLKSGKIMDMTRAVPYRKQMLQQMAADVIANPKKTGNEIMGSYGVAVSDGDDSVTKVENDKVGSAIDALGSFLSQGEKDYFDAVPGVEYGNIAAGLNGIAEGIKTGMIDITNNAARYAEDANWKYNKTWLGSLASRNEYERYQTTANSLAAEVEDFEKKNGTQILASESIESEPVFSLDDGTQVQLIYDDETGEYEVGNVWNDMWRFGQISPEQLAAANEKAEQLRIEQNNRANGIRAAQAEAGEMDADTIKGVEEYNKKKEQLAALNGYLEENKAGYEQSIRDAEIAKANRDALGAIAAKAMGIEYDPSTADSIMQYAGGFYQYESPEADGNSLIDEIHGSSVADIGAMIQENNKVVQDVQFIMNTLGDSIPDDLKQHFDAFLADAEKQNRVYNNYLITNNPNFLSLVEKGRDAALDMSDIYNVKIGNTQKQWFPMMTPEEVDIYFALAARDGIEAADQFYLDLRDDLMTRLDVGIENVTRKTAESGALGRFVSEIGAILPAAINSISGMVYSAGVALGADEKELRILKVGSHLSQSQHQANVNAIKETYKDNPALAEVLSGAYEILYNRGNSFMTGKLLGQFMPNIEGGGKVADFLNNIFSATPIALSAASDALEDAIKRNADPKQQAIIFASTLIAESWTEGIEFGHIEESGKLLLTKKGITTFLKNYIPNALSEVVGESANDLIENAADYWVKYINNPDYQTQHDNAVRDALAKDDTLTPEQAEALVHQAEVDGVLHTAIISFFSPGADVVAMTGNTLTTYLGYAQEAREYNQNATGKHAKQKSIRDIRLEHEAAEAEARRAAEEAQTVRTETPVETAQTEQTEQVQPEQYPVNGPAESQRRSHAQAMNAYETGIIMLEEAADADATAQAAAIATVINTGDNYMAQAAAAKLNIGMVQGILVAGQQNNIDINTLSTGLQLAALGNGQCADILANGAANGLGITQMAQQIAAAVSSDMQNPGVAQGVAAGIHDARVNEEFKRLMATGLGDAAVEAQAKIDAAREATRAAEQEAEQKNNELEAARKGVSDAAAAVAANPINDGNQMTGALAKMTSAAAVAQEYAQKLDKARKDQQKVEDDNRKAIETTTAYMRQQAEQTISQQEQAEAQAKAEAEAQASAEAAAAHAEEDARTGKADEDSRRAAIDAEIQRRGLTGEKAESVREQLYRFDNDIAMRKLDMNQILSNSESALAIGMLSRRLGVAIEVGDMPEGKNGKYSNGKITLSNKLTVGQAMVEVALHEITHSLENTKSYSKYKSVVESILFNNPEAKQKAVQDRIDFYKRNGVDLTTEDAEAEIVADFAKNNLANRQTVERMLDEGIGGTMRNILHNINQFLKNARLTGEERKTAENFRRAERLFQKAINERRNISVHPSNEQFSVNQFAEAAGLFYNEIEIKDDNGNIVAKPGLYTTDPSKDTNAKRVEQVTPEMIQSTPVGMLTNSALALGTMNQETVGKIHKMFADLMNMCVNLNDTNLVWEIAGSTLYSEFSAIKANSDKQYSSTVDFGTICTKTQAVVDQLSRDMLRLGRGLKATEILQVYNDVYEADLKVPCPVCYVFSRWLGVPSLLENIRQYQNRFLGEEGQEVSKEETQKRVNEFIANAHSQEFGIDETFIEAQKAARNKAQKSIDSVNKKVAAIQAKIAGYQDKLNANPNDKNAKRYLASAENNLAKFMDDLAKAKENYENADVAAYAKVVNKKKADIEGKIKDKQVAIEGNDKGERGINDDISDALKEGKPIDKLVEKRTKLYSEIDELNAKLREVDAYNWVTQALCKLDKDGNFVIDDDFHRTRNEILLDLNRTGEFAKDVKNWTYRCTRGAGMGKAILPYSGASIGDSVLGVGARTMTNPYKDGDVAGAFRSLRDAITKAKRQNLIGGQRFQSTSDFRPEWGLDYILTFIEQQAIGSNGQLYTKVNEAVPLYASAGIDVNCSIMPSSNGWHKATAGEIESMSDSEKKSRVITFKDDAGNDQTVVLDFSGVTGMEYGAARLLSKMFDNVQMIMVGINDVHIKACLAGEEIDFVIPWHASGNTKGQLSRMMQTVGEQLTNSSDYTKVQTDGLSDADKKDLKEAHGRVERGEDLTDRDLDLLHKEEMRDARERLLTGKTLTATDIERIAESKYLTSLYERFEGKTLDGKELPHDSNYWIELPDKDGNMTSERVKMTTGQAEQIFPYEYWDTSLRKEDADQNGWNFIEYCQELGLVPRFSGGNQKSETTGEISRFGNFSGAVYDEAGNIVGYDREKMAKGYWKLLIDRKMYDNNGNYRSQQQIDASNVKAGGLMAGEDGKMHHVQSNIPDQTAGATYRGAEAEAKHRQADKAFYDRQSKEDQARIDAWEDSHANTREQYSLVGDINAAAEMTTGEMLQMFNDAGIEMDIDMDEDAEVDDREVITAAVKDIEKDYDPTIYNGKLYLKPETLEHWLSDRGYGSTNPDYAQCYITTMDPADFLRMTTVTARGQQRILNEAGFLNRGNDQYGDSASLERQARTQPIMLDINEANGVIEGHEGRHRSIALARAGVKEIPVLLYDASTKYSKTAKDQMTLKGQGNYDFANGNTITFSDVIPLNNAHRDEIFQRFTASDAEKIDAESNQQSILQYDIADNGSNMTVGEMQQFMVDAGVATKEQFDVGPGKYAIPLEGENPSETLPSEGNAQRQFGSQTAQRSDELDASVRQFLKDNSGYVPDTNEAQINRAIQWIRSNKNSNESDGLAESIQKIAMEDFDYRSADGQARMVATMGLAVAKKDAIAQAALADAYNRQGTDLGRALQARKLFRLMTPAGRVATLQKMLQNTQAELAAKGRNIDLKFSDWIYMAASAANNEGDFQRVQKRAAEELAEQIPANWKDKLRTLRMLSMLGNPRTHVRNIIGNALFVPAVSIKNKLGAVAELGLKPGERTKTMRFAVDKSIRDFAKQDAIAMKDDLTGDSRWNEGDAVKREVKPFKGFMQKLVDANGNALEFEDWFFLKGHYTRALGGWMQANGYTAEQMRNNPALLEKGRAYAVQEAQKATYRDANKLAQTLNKVSREGGVAGFLVDAVLPFKKTPANILRRGIEYSPVGIMKTLTADAVHLKQYMDAKNGKLSVMPDKAISPNQFIDHLCAGLTGSAIMAVGALLASMGVVSAGMDDDDDKFDELRGGQEYSFKVNLFGQDVTYTMDWAAPMSMPFFVGAAIFDQLDGERGDFNVESLINDLGAMAEPVFNLSMLDGVNTLFQTSQYDDTNTITQIGGKIASNYVTSYVPSLLGGIARTVDPVRRKSFVKSGEGGGLMGTFRYAIEQTQNKIPGLSQQNIAYRNAWGEADESSFVEKVFENFLSPGYISPVKEDPVLDELERLYNSTEVDDSTRNNLIPKLPNKSVSGTALEAEQYDAVTVQRGQTAKNLLTELMNTDYFKSAADQDRASMVADVWTFATQTANNAAVGRKLDGWVLNTQTNPVQGIINRSKKTVADETKNGWKAEAVQAVQMGDFDALDVCIERLGELGVKKSSVKTAVGNAFKEDYIKAYQRNDFATMYDIEGTLEDTGLFTYADFEKWLDDMNKSIIEDEDEVVVYDAIGQYGRGNIDLNNRQVVRNDDGSISTERSFSTNIDGKEVLLPTVINGRVVSEEEAIEHYFQTGEYLGKFDTVEEANRYAEMLHNRQDQYYNR